MALNIKNPDVDKLVAELSKLTGQSKTEVIRRALLDFQITISLGMIKPDKKGRLKEFLEKEVWGNNSKKLAPKKLSQKEQNVILGYGKDGV